MPERKPVVAIVDSNPELIEVLQIAIEGSGYRTTAVNLPEIRRTLTRYYSLLKRHDPTIFVWDIPIPYEENWQLLQSVRALEESQNREFILTTTNKARLEELVGATDTLELVGKPFDIAEIIDSVQRAHQSIRSKLSGR